MNARLSTKWNGTLKARAIRIAVALLVGGAQTPCRAGGGWPLPHLGGDNNAVADLPTQVEDVSGGPKWNTPNLDLADRAPVTVFDPFIYNPGELKGEPGTPGVVHAIDAYSGDPLWQTEPLDTAGFLSSSAVTVVESENAIYYPSGTHVYKFNALTGQMLWETELSGDNTATSPTVQSWTIVNSSAMPGSDKVFLETFGGFTPSYKQLVALDRDDGEVAWFVNDGGLGNGNPLFLAGTPNRVYSTGEDNLRCYNADSGALLWDSAVDTPTTWTTAPWVIFATVAHADGRIYTVGADSAFTATTTTLVCADALTGDLLWQVDAPVSDCPPLILDGRVYIYGGGFPARLAAYDAVTGAPIFNTVIAPFAFVFRAYMAATQDHLYMTDDTNLYVVDPADGSVVSEVAGTYAGPVTIDELGGIYVHQATFSVESYISAFGQTVPVELGSFTIE
jgi:outer membrane protein assembly factor BamB